MTTTIVRVCHYQGMTAKQPRVTAGTIYWALLDGGPFAGAIVEQTAETEGPADELSLSGDAGDAVYKYQGTGTQGTLRYLHEYVCISAAGPAIGSTRPA